MDTDPSRRSSHRRAVRNPRKRPKPEHSTNKEPLTATIDPAGVELQEQSPLYSSIPPEVRTRIFKFALKPGHDEAHAYEEGSLYFRPTHTSDPSSYTGLLRSCRRIYLEIAFLPRTTRTLTYWWARPPPGKPACRVPTRDLHELNEELRKDVAVHVFIQQFQLEQGFREVLADPLFRPAHLTFTLRHTDWWYWEDKEPIALAPKCNSRPTVHTMDPNRTFHGNRSFHASSWGEALCNVWSLKTFTLELETVMEKKDEMNAIVESLTQISFPMKPDKSETDSDTLEDAQTESAGPKTSNLVYDPSSKKVWQWKGIDRFYEIERRQEQEALARLRANRSESGRVMGRVMPRFTHAMRQRTFVENGVVQGETGNGNEIITGDATASAQPPPEPEQLEYYVVELTWRMVKKASTDAGRA